jgi:signal transduction histidine kinase
LVRRIPGTPAGEAQFYVLQRAFDPELTFASAIRKDLLAIAAVALILALVAGWLFSSQILGPIRRLVRGAREMQAGNYDVPLDVRRQDELGYLARQFTDMRQRERAYVEGLEQATRLKSEFIHLASHELRTPISVIAGFLDLLADPNAGALSPAQQRMVDSMRQHLGRLTRVAENATQIAEVHSERIELDRQPTALSRLVSHAIGVARAGSSGREVRIENETDPDAGAVSVDVQRLSEAIANMISNGIRFTPDGGCVRISAWLEAGELLVAVADNGDGIAPEQLEALRSHGHAVHDAQHHRSSTTLEHGSHGLGLGLPLARGIIEAHGGTLRIESELGRGSVFTIVIPVADQELRAAA